MEATPGASCPTQHAGRGNYWEGPHLAVTILGEQQDFTSPGGWQIFVLGQSRCAEVVARALDRSYGGGGALLLSKEDGRAISWGTLPSAVVLAAHTATGRVCLIRDSAGFRPLYYTYRFGVLRFSTNLRHLRAQTPETGINTDKIVEMLAFGHRSGGRTLWQGINVVGPGRLVEFRGGGHPHQHQFWHPESLFEVAERQRLEACSSLEVLTEIGAALDEALAPLQTLESLAVPCGGGVDSSLLGAYLKRTRGQLHFFTVNKTDADRQEAEWMQSLSRGLQIPCEYVNVTRENFFSAYFEFLALSEQPAIGANLVSHRILRRKAWDMGERHFVSGELCDTVFGGLSSFYYLSRRFRLLRMLSALRKQDRFWLIRALSGEKSLLLEIMRTARGEELGLLAGADLERTEFMTEIDSFRYPGQSSTQHMADQLTWMNLRLIPSSLHNAFFEYDEHPGGVTYFPFAHPRLLRLGLHLPHSLKRNQGANKWVWRKFAEPYIGKEVAFRKKYAFPAPIHTWFDKAVLLLPNGFLEDLFCARVGDLARGMGPEDPSRWTLVNLELWGRVNCWKEDPAALLGRVL
jgi:asparagine synthetase B (glutamine-hydrolysing)